MLHRIAGLCGIAAVFLSLTVTLLGAWSRPGYDHWSQYISELGEHGATHGAAVSLLGFLPTGAFVLAFVVLAARCLPQATTVRIAMICFSGVGFAYITAAFARCDPGCPDNGSPSQAVHNLLGLIEYLGALLGLSLLGWSLRSEPGWRSLAVVSMAGAGVVLIGFVGMLLGDASLRGLFQRLAEAAIFIWILAVSLHLLAAIPALQRS